LIYKINKFLEKYCKRRGKRMFKNLWILTEERPKKEVIEVIFQKYLKDNNISGFIDYIRILPVLDNDNSFSFVYEITGIKTPKIHNIYIKIISGTSSFVDYLVFESINEPNKMTYHYMQLKKLKLMIKKVEIQEYIKGVQNLFMLIFSIQTYQRLCYITYK
jgi:hypothetical protein